MEVLKRQEKDLCYLNKIRLGKGFMLAESTCVKCGALHFRLSVCPKDRTNKPGKIVPKKYFHLERDRQKMYLARLD